MIDIPRIEKIVESARRLEPILKNRSNSPSLPLSTLPILNTKIWGLRENRLTTIGARTSHGKSTVALQFALDLASQNIEVLFLSLEMDNTEMAERAFCHMHRVDNYELLKGNFQANIDKWNDFLARLKTFPLVFSDMVGKNWKDVDNYLSEMTIRPKVVIVDYVQATKGDQRSQKEQFDDYIIHFREMAMRYRFAGILCSQVNRGSQDGKNKEPGMHQLKGTGVLEEHSDVVMLLYHPYKNDNSESINKYKIDVAKNRNGRTGEMDLYFYPEYYLITDQPLGSQNVPEQWED